MQPVRKDFTDPIASRNLDADAFLRGIDKKGETCFNAEARACFFLHRIP